MVGSKYAQVPVRAREWQIEPVGDGRHISMILNGLPFDFTWQEAERLSKELMTAVDTATLHPALAQVNEGAVVPGVTPDTVDPEPLKARKGNGAFYLMPDGFLAPAVIVSVYDYQRRADLCVFTRMGPLPLTSQERAVGLCKPGQWYPDHDASVHVPSDTRE